MCTVVRVARTTAKVADVVFLCDNTWITPEELTYTDTIDSFGVVLAISTPSPQNPDIRIDIVTSGHAFINAYWDPAGLVPGTIIGFAFRDDILRAVPMSDTAHDIPIAVYHGGASFSGTSAVAPRDRWHARSQRMQVSLVPLRAAVLCVPDPVIAKAAALRADETRFAMADFIAVQAAISTASAVTAECARLRASTATLQVTYGADISRAHQFLPQIIDSGYWPVRSQQAIINRLSAITTPQSSAHYIVSVAMNTCNAAVTSIDANYRACLTSYHQYFRDSKREVARLVTALPALPDANKIVSLNRIIALCRIFATQNVCRVVNTQAEMTAIKTEFARKLPLAMADCARLMAVRPPVPLAPPIAAPAMPPAPVPAPLAPPIAAPGATGASGTAPPIPAAPALVASPVVASVVASAVLPVALPSSTASTFTTTVAPVVLPLAPATAPVVLPPASVVASAVLPPAPPASVVASAVLPPAPPAPSGPLSVFTASARKVVGAASRLVRRGPTDAPAGSLAVLPSPVAIAPEPIIYRTVPRLEAVFDDLPSRGILPGWLGTPHPYYAFEPILQRLNDLRTQSDAYNGKILALGAKILKVCESHRVYTLTTLEPTVYQPIKGTGDELITAYANVIADFATLLTGYEKYERIDKLGAAVSDLTQYILLITNGVKENFREIAGDTTNAVRTLYDLLDPLISQLPSMTLSAEIVQSPEYDDARLSSGLVELEILRKIYKIGTSVKCDGVFLCTQNGLTDALLSPLNTKMLTDRRAEEQTIIADLLSKNQTTFDARTGTLKQMFSVWEKLTDPLKRGGIFTNEVVDKASHLKQSIGDEYGRFVETGEWLRLNGPKNTKTINLLEKNRLLFDAMTEFMDKLTGDDNIRQLIWQSAMSARAETIKRNWDGVTHSSTIDAMNVKSHVDAGSITYDVKFASSGSFDDDVVQFIQAFSHLWPSYTIPPVVNVADLHDAVLQLQLRKTGISFETDQNYRSRIQSFNFYRLHMQNLSGLISPENKNKTLPMLYTVANAISDDLSQIIRAHNTIVENLKPILNVLTAIVSCVYSAVVKFDERAELIAKCVHSGKIDYTFIDSNLVGQIVERIESLTYALRGFASKTQGNVMRFVATVKFMSLSDSVDVFFDDPKIAKALWRHYTPGGGILANDQRAEIQRNIATNVSLAESGIHGMLTLSCDQPPAVDAEFTKITSFISKNSKKAASTPTNIDTVCTSFFEYDEYKVMHNYADSFEPDGTFRDKLVHELMVKNVPQLSIPEMLKDLISVGPDNETYASYSMAVRITATSTRTRNLVIEEVKKKDKRIQCVVDIVCLAYGTNTPPKVDEDEFCVNMAFIMSYGQYDPGVTCSLRTYVVNTVKKRAASIEAIERKITALIKNPPRLPVSSSRAYDQLQHIGKIACLFYKMLGINAGIKGDEYTEKEKMRIAIAANEGGCYSVLTALLAAFDDLARL